MSTECISSCKVIVENQSMANDPIRTCCNMAKCVIPMQFPKLWRLRFNIRYCEHCWPGFTFLALIYSIISQHAELY